MPSEYRLSAAGVSGPWCGAVKPRSPVGPGRLGPGARRVSGLGEVLFVAVGPNRFGQNWLVSVQVGLSRLACVGPGWLGSGPAGARAGLKFQNVALLNVRRKPSPVCYRQGRVSPDI